MSVALLSVVFGLATCQIVVAQAPVAPDVRDVAAYEAFLQNVAASNRSAPPDSPVKTAIQKAFDLTDRETEALKAVATDYEMKNSRFLAVVRPLRMEAVLQLLDSGRVSESLVKQISDLQAEHAKMIFDEIQRMKVALGTPRFEVFDARVPKTSK